MKPGKTGSGYNNPNTSYSHWKHRSRHARARRSRRSLRYTVLKLINVLLPHCKHMCDVSQLFSLLDSADWRLFLPDLVSMILQTYRLTVCPAYAQFDLRIFVPIAPSHDPSHFTHGHPYSIPTSLDNLGRQSRLVLAPPVPNAFFGIHKLYVISLSLSL